MSPAVPETVFLADGAGGTAAIRPWFAGLRLPLLRGRARPLAKLADADKAGIVVGQRQRTTPGTAPRRGGSQGPGHGRPTRATRPYAGPEVAIGVIWPRHRKELSLRAGSVKRILGELNLINCLTGRDVLRTATHQGAMLMLCFPSFRRSTSNWAALSEQS